MNNIDKKSICKNFINTIVLFVSTLTINSNFSLKAYCIYFQARLRLANQMVRVGQILTHMKSSGLMTVSIVLPCTVLNVPVLCGSDIIPDYAIVSAERREERA